jgi:hypothetical protein
MQLTRIFASSRLCRITRGTTSIRVTKDMWKALEIEMYISVCRPIAKYHNGNLKRIRLNTRISLLMSDWNSIGWSTPRAARTRDQDILTDRWSQRDFDFWLLTWPSSSWGIYVRGPNPPGWGSLKWDSKVWLRVLCNSDHWVITLQIADLSSRQRGRLPEMRPQISDSNTPKGSNIWSQVPQGCSIPRHTDWLSVSRKVTSTSTSTVEWKLCEQAIERQPLLEISSLEHFGGISAVKSRYQATASKDCSYSAVQCSLQLQWSFERLNRWGCLICSCVQCFIILTTNPNSVYSHSELCGSKSL